MKLKLTKEQKEEIEKISNRYQLKLILIHGSWAKGQQRWDSDLDIAVLGKKPINFDKLLDIMADLEKVFATRRKRELDIKSLEEADSLFLYQVMKDSILIYGSPFDYWQLRTFAIRNYWDHFPIFKLEDTLIKKYFDFNQ